MDRLIRIAICEDSPQDAETLRQMIMAEAQPCEIELYNSGEAFLEAKPAGRFDLLFMDVYMGEITGVETAKRFREQDKDCAIVLTTSSEDHALEGFQIKAMRYLLKPIEQADVKELVKRRREALRPVAGEVIIVSSAGRRREILMQDIYYVEVFDKRCFIHLAEETLETSTSIADLNTFLPSPKFLRCHRAYIVNLEHVLTIDRDFIMQNGDKVYISHGDIKKCTTAYKEYLLYRARRDL